MPKDRPEIPVSDEDFAEVIGYYPNGQKYRPFCEALGDGYKRVLTLGRNLLARLSDWTPQTEAFPVHLGLHPSLVYHLTKSSLPIDLRPDFRAKDQRYRR